jgi:hypothetical protein
VRAVSAAVVKLPRAAAVPSYVCDQPGPLPTHRLAFVVVQDNRAVRPTAISRAEAENVIEGGPTLWARAGNDTAHSDIAKKTNDPNTTLGSLGINPTFPPDTDNVLLRLRCPTVA